VAHEDPVLQALCDGHPPWQQVALIAGRQGRAISVAQLRACGISRQQVLTATDRRHLHRVHRGVLAVGTPGLSTLGRHWAAFLAAGGGSALSDRSGGAIYGIRPWTGTIHLACATHRRGHRGVVVHRVACLDRTMIATRNGLPVLKPAHVLLDLAAALDADPLAIALNQALSIPVVGLDELDAVIDVRRGHRGTGRLAAALAEVRDDPGAGRTHSELEELVLTLLRRLPALPPFTRNQLVTLANGHVAKADMLFADQRVLVELDSRRWHAQKRAMEDDRRRDQQALAVGLVTFRITWRHAVRQWAAVSQDLRATLQARGASRTSGRAGRS
jgi:very-short-patch-repair endonuclease